MEYVTILVGLVALTAAVVQGVMLGSLLRRRFRPTTRAQMRKYVDAMRQQGWKVSPVEGDDAFIATYEPMIDGSERKRETLATVRPELDEASTLC